MIVVFKDLASNQPKARSSSGMKWMVGRRRRSTAPRMVKPFVRGWRELWVVNHSMVDTHSVRPRLVPVQSPVFRTGPADCWEGEKGSTPEGTGRDVNPL